MTRRVKFRLGLLLGTTKRFWKYNVPSSATVKEGAFPLVISLLIFSTSESHVCIHLMVSSRSGSTTGYLHDPEEQSRGSTFETLHTEVVVPVEPQVHYSRFYGSKHQPSH